MGNYAKCLCLLGCAELQSVVMNLREWKGQLKAGLSPCLCPRKCNGVKV